MLPETLLVQTPAQIPMYLILLQEPVIYVLEDVQLVLFLAITVHLVMADTYLIINAL
jgi:hypothetical protein